MGTEECFGETHTVGLTPSAVAGTEQFLCSHRLSSQSPGTLGGPAPVVARSSVAFSRGIKAAPFWLCPAPCRSCSEYAVGLVSH